MVFVGIDVAAESFTATVFFAPEHYTTSPHDFSNSEAGIEALQGWLHAQDVPSDQLHVCLENTGVYSELLSYQLHDAGYRVSLLDPRTLSKAFPDGEPKTDRVDSRKLAEYGFRYADRLRIWEPQTHSVEQIRVVLATREQLVQQKTAVMNSRSALTRKRIQTPAANRALDSTLANLKEQIAQLETELKRLLRSHRDLLEGVTLLMTAPGVSWLLSGHFAVLTRGFTEVPNYRSLAQYLGVAPNEYQSGTSIRRRPRSRRYGPASIRKLLHLAARSIGTHDPSGRTYYRTKTTLGKPKQLVINNLANKLLKRLCAMLRHRSAYIEGFRSLDPRYLALA
jgi:transposase